jgi:hypothetical protein
MAGSAGRFIGLSGLMQARFEIQRGTGILFEQLVVANLAIAIGAFHVSGVVENDDAILGGKREFRGRFLFLSKRQCPYQGAGEKGH